MTLNIECIQTYQTPDTHSIKSVSAT